MAWTIYALRDPRNGAERYIGATSRSLPARLGEHLAHPVNAHVRDWLDELRALGDVPRIVAIETIADTNRVGAEARESAIVRERLAAGVSLLNIHTAAASITETICDAAKQLREFRLAHHISLRGASSALGLSAPSYLAWERGRALPVADFRRAIEVWSDGAVRADSWPVKRADHRAVA